MNGGWHNYGGTAIGTGALYIDGKISGSTCDWKNYGDCGKMYISASKSNPKYTSVNRIYPLSTKVHFALKY